MSLSDAVDRKRRQVRRGLLAWFAREARDLPWRRTADPYRIWVSEVMLQQTQVGTVLPYYRRFLRAFPTVSALADAPIDRVLKLWEGLGYYRRAAHLHAAANVIARERAGRLPRSAEQWGHLPGVGRYTAAAIASIAFGERVAVLDGNVKRVLARLLAVRASVDASATAAALWRAAERLVPARRPGEFNEAMMELGARICRPRHPRCPECPIRRQCDAHAEGLTDTLPIRDRRKRTPHYQIVAAVIEKRGWFLIGRRPANGMLGRLWEFPGGKVNVGETHAAALVREVGEEVGIEVAVGERIAVVEHAYSHFSITLHLYRCRHVSGRPEAKHHSRIRWVPRSHLRRYAFPAANKRVLPLL